MAVTGSRLGRAMAARRRVLGACLAAALASGPASAILVMTASPALAAPTAQPPTAETFLRLAHGSAIFQARAAELASSRQTSPEVRAFAEQMVEFRREHAAKLLAAARERSLALPSGPEGEQKAILDNLEPLDSLELSRRYAEVQVQALEQELQGYTGSEASPDEWVRTFAHDTRPRLQLLLEEARKLRQTVGP